MEGNPILEFSNPRFLQERKKIEIRGDIGSTILFENPARQKTIPKEGGTSPRRPEIDTFFDRGHVSQRAGYKVGHNARCLCQSVFNLWYLGSQMSLSVSKIPAPQCRNILDEARQLFSSLESRPSRMNVMNRLTCSDGRKHSTRLTHRPPRH
jgi:hypothetical protein